MNTIGQIEISIYFVLYRSLYQELTVILEIRNTQTSHVLGEGLVPRRGFNGFKDRFTNFILILLNYWLLLHNKQFFKTQNQFCS